ncbi:hypothetical protein GJA_5283 [Janthinobacterium agaricidamnosum NBRC 102515 = DSM 9628]|uniref:Uncharacterized protein n=1 Tax=Janthinobacterium agaricidamnosum NBRC 102515 = DSM 9628 TaxID=1349767 RepID=W0VAN6_9BURK|nr:hypothetical protein GJA_5283 [Janthinobacterium agaricidamnosum NBRC 102515 = DSM 9628]
MQHINLISVADTVYMKHECNSVIFTKMKQTVNNTAILLNHLL